MSCPPMDSKAAVPFTPAYSGFWLHSSQTNLEKVLQSRLVETMVSLDVSVADMLTEDGPSSSVTPSFLSDIHSPSTSPMFTVGTHSYSSWTNTGTSRVTLLVFGRVKLEERPSVSSKGKERASEQLEGATEARWSLLQCWTFDLNELIAVPEDRATTKLPFNCPVFTFGSSSQQYYLRTGPTSRMQAEDDGHRSVTESDPRTAMNSSTSVSPRSSPKRAATSRKSRAEVGEPITASQRRRGNLSSTTWQDLIKYVAMSAVLTTIC